MTPPIHEQVDALEQWARNYRLIGAPQRDRILALIASWREGQQERGLRVIQQLRAERDVAVYRAEQAERELAHWRDVLAVLPESAKGYLDLMKMARDERDAARAEAAALRAGLQRISDLLPCKTPCSQESKPDCPTCGAYGYTFNCAGCMARAALEAHR